jgi:hypothetical protein
MRLFSAAGLEEDTAMAKAKDKTKTKSGDQPKKAKGKGASAGSSKKAAGKSKASSADDASKVTDAVRMAKRKAADLASNPAVAEVVAATLVAAAAAIRNPTKARELASSARDELQAAGKAGAGQGSAMWQLALDIAKRSVDALGKDGDGKRKGKAKGKS